MKTQLNTMPLNRERLMYRRAVRLLLRDIFDRSELEAKQLTDTWWSNIGRTQAWKSGVFMHDEPLNVAAEIVNVEAPEIWSLGEKYEETMRRAKPKVRVPKTACNNRQRAKAA